jgi:glycosyltransferase involved in cell wall biosynthesis
MKKVAIVIPCRNEEQYISKCLDSVLACNYPKEFLEVLVCDGLSDDRTTEIVKNYSLKYPFIRLLVNHKRTTPFALNIGIKGSNADIIIILGAHAEISEDYLTNCINIFNIDPQIGCVGGLLEHISEDEKTATIAMAMSSTFGVGNAYFRTGEKEGFVDTVAFGAYKKEVFENIGLFDEELVRNQDDEFNYRLIKAGYKIYLSRETKTRYYVRTSFIKFFKQYFQYGYWKVYVNKKHKTITTMRQLIPAAFVLFLLIGSLISLFSTVFLKIFLAFTILYFLLGIISAISINKKESSIKNTLSIMFSYLILHLSYGIGYINGLIRFAVMGIAPSNRSAKTSR